MEKTYLKVFAHCIPVTGKDHAALYNLSTCEVLVVPDSMVDFIAELEASPVSKVREKFGTQRETVEEYLDFLIRNDCAFFTDTPELFPPLVKQYNTSQLVCDATVEYAGRFDLRSVARQLDGLNCKMLELRVLSRLEDTHELFSLVRAFSKTSIRSMGVIVKHCPGIALNEIVELMPEYRKLSLLIVAEAPMGKKVEADNCQVVFTPATLEALFDKSRTQRKTVINYEMFMECHFYNPYYNEKVCIDRNGDIKNCLNLPRSFGNVSTSALSEVVSGKAFQELWKASPDKIEGLKDSPFRYCQYVTGILERKPGSGDLYQYAGDNQVFVPRP